MTDAPGRGDDDDDDDLAVRMWRAPLVDRFTSGEVAALEDPVNVAMLALALATDLEMGGLGAYFQNRTGTFADVTVHALRLLDRPDDAEALDTAVVLRERGMSLDFIDEIGAAFDVDGIRDAATTWALLHERP